MVNSTMEIFNTLRGNDEPAALREKLVAPIAVERYSESAWQDFQETQAAYEEDFIQSNRVTP